MTQWRLMGWPNIIGANGGNARTSILGKSTLALTEALAECKFYTAFTCSDLRVEFQTVFSTATVTLRDDGVDTDVSVAVSGTGWTEDLTDSATVVADSLMYLETVNDGTMHGENIEIDSSLLTIEHASTNAPIMGGGDVSTITATAYSVMGSTTLATPTEADARITIQRATVLSNLRINIRAVTSADWDVSPFKNGTASSTVIVVNITATGALEDVTGSESYAADDTASFGFVRTAGTIALSQIQIDADTPEVWLSTSDNVISSTRAYIPFSDEPAFTSTKDDFDMRIGSVSAGHLETFISVAGSGTRDVSLRVETTNSTNLTINVTTTGYLADLTGSESIADSNSMMTTAIAPTTDMTVDWAAVECPWSDPSGGAPSRRIFIT